MKSLFKKLSSPRHHHHGRPLTPPPKKRSASQLSEPALTASEVRSIMASNSPAARPVSSIGLEDDVDFGSLPDRHKHRWSTTEEDIALGHPRQSNVYSHRARAHRIVEVHRNDSDPDLGVQFKKKLTVSVSVPDGRELTRHGSMDDLNTMNKGEEVEYRWKAHRRQPSDTSPGVDPDIIRRELQNPVRAVYNPRNTECLVAVIERTSGLNINTLDKKTGESPLHALIKRERRDRVQLVLTLLIYADADINLETTRGATPLHLAVETKDVLLVKTLLAFGANINHQGLNDFTPLDLAIHSQCSEVERVLLEHGAKGSANLIMLQQRQLSVVPSMQSLDECRPRLGHGQRLKTSDRLQEYIQRMGTAKLHQELENYINQRLTVSLSLGRNGADELMAIAHQQKEMSHFNKTLKKKSAKDSPFLAGMEGGSRLLFMDGGGIKGLSQIETLIQLEEATGRKITELFDWIVGTSTGGVIALALVYAKVPLSKVRQFYFRIKNKVFAKARFGLVFSAQEVEKLFREEFGDITMDKVHHPKVLIAAVDKSTTNPELRFFNNCFGDGFDEQLVWKVARYTSASPIFFGEYENYVDGGVLANNPCDCGLTAIQNFYRLQGERLLISLVVSVGSGEYPAEEMGKVDAQEFLFFGKHWLKLSKLRDRATNLISLLSNALVNSELVAGNCKSRCEEMGIPYYRLSPKLSEVVPPGETDDAKIIDMILETKLQVKEQGVSEIVQIFLLTAEYSQRCKKKPMSQKL